MSQKPKCKLCGERHNSWEPHVFKSERVTTLAGSGPKARVTPTVTPTEEEVTRSITQERPVLVPVTERVTPGEECPTCGQKVPMTNAQRQAAYRGRKA